MRRLVAEGAAAPALLAPAPRKASKDDALRIAADPTLSLRAIAARLEALHVRPPRGGAGWSASSVKALLDCAERLGLEEAVVAPP